MKRIYLAGPFSWQERIRQHAKELERLGYVITGQWLYQAATFTNPDNTTNTKKPGLHADCERLSIRDICNIFDADTLVLFETGTPLERVTRVAEFGGALFTGRQCIVIQPPDEDKKDIISNIFVKLRNIPPELARHGVKPVQEYRFWEDFYSTLVAPAK